MADNNKAEASAPGENTEECGQNENVDEEDPASENPEIQIVPALNAPPEKECVLFQVFAIFSTSDLPRKITNPFFIVVL